MTQPRLASNLTGTILAVLGIVLYVAVGFVYLTSGLVVPTPWLWPLWATWLIGFYPLVRLFRTRRAWVILVPVAAVLLWWGYLYLGETFLDWTA